MPGCGSQTHRVVVCANGGLSHVVHVTIAGTGVPFCLAAITVGAINTMDTRASFSNYGSTLDLFAPGVSIVTPVVTGGYAFWSGTSMATQYTAGAAALLREVRASLALPRAKGLYRCPGAQHRHHAACRGLEPGAVVWSARSRVACLSGRVHTGSLTLLSPTEVT